MRKGRVEAITDGVMGVAMTLLVLDLRPDFHSPDDLASQLRALWPSFAAYLVSFIVVGAIWLNHYHLFRLAIDVDHHVIVYNLMLLFFVTAIPFTTAAYAAYLLGDVNNARLSVILYCIAMEGAAVSLMLMLEHLLRAGLMGEGLSPQQSRDLRKVYRWRIVMYLAIMVVGLIKPLVMLVLYLVSVAVLVRPLMRTLTLNLLPEQQV